MSKRVLKYLRTRIKDGDLEVYQPYIDSIKF